MASVEIPPEWGKVVEKANQVNDIQPVGIQEIVQQYTDASKNSADHANHLKQVSEPLKGIWKGTDADAFFAQVTKVLDAGKNFNDRLDDVAKKYAELQETLSTIKNNIVTEREGANTDIQKIVGDANRAITTAQAAVDAHNADNSKPMPSPTPEEIAQKEQGRADARAKAAGDRVSGLLTEANNALKTTSAAAQKEISGGYSSVKPTGGGGATRQAKSSGGLSSGGGGGPSTGGGGSGGLGPSGGPPGAPPPGNVDQWIREAIKILQANGIPVTDADIQKIWTIIEKESGGDPNAINNWDSNAAKGTPSKGLMQCIDPTFNAHKLPGHDDIYNPVDNIIAGVRYTFDRYGGFEGHPGLKAMAGGGGYQGY
ncbi:transglycosylase SLT domain-containing protein [Amycolatopsis nigrescens]|uniref:transglycosylase SLT domain-containing protein n=1 Tax=Amycolatopsis nigrescens TaxID=381445 RepID=UPI000475DA3F|nr:transglycosylase SLT domain-containing protein [Amycolatopsis nigrescens]